MLVKRNIENQIINVAETFPALILTGSRQVGKSTLLKYLADEKKIKINSYVTLDDYNDLKLAIDDPEEFFLKYKTPLVIDEIQKAPQLFQMIKKIIDKEPKNGLFFLTGSESFGLMKNVSETLAGRVAILELLPFSTTEINQYKNGIFLPTTFKNYNDKSMTQDDICNIIYKGLFPKITIEKNIDIDLYYESYIKTYIERDLRQFINIKNLMKFRNFLSTVAVRSGCELIIDELAKDNDIDNKTVLLWLSALEASNLIFLIQPFYSSEFKKLTKRKKIYFCDCGLARYLIGINSLQSLKNSFLIGQLWETYVVIEIIKSFVNNGKQYKNSLYWFRNNSKEEIDLIIEYDNIIYPIEIKKTTTPNYTVAKTFSILERIKNKKIGLGSVICNVQDINQLNATTVALPIKSL